MEAEIINQAVGTALGLLQAALIAAFASTIKTHFDVRQHRRDINEAFKKIRDIEKKLQP